MQRLWELARLATDNIWRSKLRTTLTVVGVAIASGALVSMIGFVLGLRHQIEEPIQKLGLLNNIEVRSVREGTQVVLDEAMVDRIESLPGVDFAYPDFRISQCTITCGSQQAKVRTLGIPREVSLIGMSEDLLVAGHFFSMGTTLEGVISEDVVAELQLESPQAALGKTIRLTAGGLTSTDENKFEFQSEVVELTIVGVYRTLEFGNTFGGDTLILPVDLMRKMPLGWMEGMFQQLRTAEGGSVRGFPRVVVRAKRPLDVMQVERDLRELGLETQSMLDRMQDMRRFFVFMEVLLSAVGTVALVVAGLGILNTQLMTVMERYQEIGIYKAIGASNNDVRWLFLVEAAVVGCCGGLAGLVLARVVSWLLGYVFNAYALSQQVDAPSAVFIFPTWLLVGAVIYAVVVCVLSGLYPASKAARIDPIRALRGL